MSFRRIAVVAAFVALACAQAAPKTEEGSTAGTLNINGEKIRITHAAAIKVPAGAGSEMFVLLTNKAVLDPEDTLLHIDFIDRLEENGVTGLMLKFEGSKVPGNLRSIHPSVIFECSGPCFDADLADFDDKRVSGRVRVPARETGDGVRYSFDVTFAARTKPLVLPKS